MTPRTGPLNNLRVLDLGTIFAGPMIGAHLGDLGAEVIKIERPGGGDDARAYAFDTLVNSEMGIERIIGTPAGRAAFTQRFDQVRIVEGDKPTIAISGHTLLVSFVPSSGAAGRASSRAIAYALGKMLALQEPA